LYKTYFGIGVQMKSLSLGLNGYYMFGALDYARVLWFPDQSSSIGIRERVTHSVSGVGWDAGLQYEATVGKADSAVNRLTIGAILGVPQTLRATTDTTVDRVIVASNENFAHLDSLTGTTGIRSELQIPLTVGFGIGYTIRRVRDLSQTFLGTDFTWQKWSGTSGLLTALQRNSWRLAAGLSHTPLYEFGAEKRFLARNTYRLGFHYGQHYLLLNDNPVDDFGVAFGFSIPLVHPSEFSIASSSPVPSTVDLSFDIGRSGGVAENLVAESYFRFTLGLNLNNNYWLFKTKID
jgi:hypothetical protein